MKNHTYTLTKWVLIAALAGIGVCIGVFSATQGYAQENTPFRITKLLRGANNPDIIAFKVYGTFKLNDVVNIYSNDAFIKSKVINKEEDVGAKEITVENISADVFKEGDNLIIARVERDGVNQARTPVFRLTIKPPPTTPDIVVLLNKEKNLYAIDIRSNFENDDEVVVYLNDSKIHTQKVTSGEVTQKKVRVANINADTLRIGENFFQASIRREGYESKKSSKEDPVVIKSEEEESQCVDYIKKERFALENGERQSQFGKHLAAYGSIFLIDTSTEASYLYRKNTSDRWMLSSRIIESESEEGGAVNKAVALHDKNTALIGVPNSWYRKYAAGAVFVYKNSGASWRKYATIAPSDLEEGEQFGSHIVTDGNILLISARKADESGVVYMYTYANGTWINPLRIVPNDSRERQYFGHSVSIEGNKIAIGAPGDGAEEAGAVYVYTKTGTKWAVEKIIQKERKERTRFGTNVLLRSGKLFISALKDSTKSLVGQGLEPGVVYVYEQAGNTMQLVQTIQSPEKEENEQFGTALAYRKGVLAIGAPKSSIRRANAGAVYVFTKQEGKWSLKKAIAQEKVENGDKFGAKVVFEGRNILISAHGEDTYHKNTGAVYYYAAQDGMCVDTTAKEEKKEEEVVKDEEKSIIDALKKRKEILEKLIEGASLLSKNIEKSIEDTFKRSAERKERYVVFDEKDVYTEAQKKAAERRGIIAPSLPDEVPVKVVVEDVDEVPEETQRGRDIVIDETRDQLGVVVPVSEKYLKRGDVDEEVYRLQVFLNENNYPVALSGAGSAGNETNIFNEATEKALKRFQLINGIPTTGVLDKRTRDIILTFVPDFGK